MAATRALHNAAPPPQGRQGRRRAETRGKLMAAAATLFARQGIENTRIQEITEAADVGFGSFYNHFDSKDAIVAAVAQEAGETMGAAIDLATEHLDDPAEVVAVAHRSLIARAAENPEFGWLLVRLEVTHDLASSTLGPYARRDLSRGIEHGRFSVEDPEVALTAAGGALLAFVRAVLQGRMDADKAHLHAASVLRVFGLSRKDAAQVAARPLPRHQRPG